MAKIVELCGQVLEPHHVMGSGSFGMALPGGDRRPTWWPRHGQNVCIRVRNSGHLTDRVREALHNVKKMLDKQGSECRLEFEV